MGENEKDLVKMNPKVLKRFREVMETSEESAYVTMANEKAAIREKGGRKGELGFESSRTIAKTKQEIKEEKIKEEKKAVEEFQTQTEILLSTPTPEPVEEEEEIEEPVIDEAAEAEFRRRVMEELQESFKLFDINGDGKISLHELISVMNSVGAGVSMEDAQEILELVDEDGDGEISFEEFKKVMHEKMVQGTVEEDLQAAFQVFDADNDGFISPSEVQSLFLKLGEMITINEAADIMQTCDLNQDGLIDFEEFKLFYNRVLGHHTKATLAVPSSNNNNMDDPGSFTFG
ncbi:uncharacterized protein LOC130657408 isoform X1 [Hydractinia symbiolongicarpus]|uniref:uncharacterized protein LOC130657408 isoform X1 n=1 Tax=Hydractinia symbiolongicarpus TaxID=13093 RepID=UPI00254EBB40|nr:uncharacterized protein LOC130657408 isoform X1 [Hydractinia symbiolongicarpus]